MGISSLFTGSSALGAFSNELDVIGNNLANLDTSGFKSQSVGFQDLLYQTLQAGTAQSGNVGSVDPQQVGFGVQLGATGTDFTQGTATATGNPLNASIQGNGFFVVNNGTQDFYTRAGDFSVDSAGILIDSNTGDAVQRFGSVGQGTATLPAFQTPGNLDITIPYGQTVPGTPTANVTLQGNISADQSVGGTTNASIQVYDTQGTTRAMTVTFTETAANTYSVSATIDGGTVTFPGGNTVTFDPTTGLLQSPSTLSAQLNGLPGAQTININLGSIGASNGITQFGSTSSSVSATAQDGTGPGTLSSISIDSTGTLDGVFSNGLSIPIAQLALASFANPSGLERSGNNYFTASAAAGNPIIGPASTGSLGSVQGGTLEGSNVDISTEFTQLIIAQNAYSVNSRTITVADQVLQDTTALIPQ